MDNTIGVHIIDRWTYYALEFLERVNPSSKATMADFVSRGGIVGTFDQMVIFKMYELMDIYFVSRKT